MKCLRSLLVFAVLFQLAPTSQERPDVGPAALVGALPSDLQKQARDLLETASEDKRASLATAIARDTPAPAVDFLVAVLRTDPSVKVRRAIIHHLGRYPDSRVVDALGEVAARDRESDLAVLALKRLDGLYALELQRLLEKRIETNPPAEPAMSQLALEHERLWCLAKNVALPAWLRTPPPVFTVSPKSSIRVLAFGDYGDGGEGQRRVAQAMLQYHRRKAVDLGITLGDNFQDTGADSPEDPRWKVRWKNLYPALRLSFFPVLGNHDWASETGPAAAVIYSQKEPHWRMPSLFYTFVAGPIQFFALDTNFLSYAQLIWLDKSLSASRTRWQVVYGHHPIYSSGVHGDTPHLADKLMPLFKGRVDAYLSGHDHHMEHLPAQEGVEFFICGTGGHTLRPVPKKARSKFSACVYGFIVVSGSRDRLSFDFVNEGQRTLYSYSPCDPRTN